MDPKKLRTVGARLVEQRARILEQQPFFGRLLMRLPFGFAPCGTAYTDMSRIVFDPDFADSLEDDPLRFVILHELMHCVLKHCLRGAGMLPFFYNVACDIVVNSVLLEALGLPEIKIGGSEAMHLAPDGKEGRLYTAEEVYRMLISQNGKDGLTAAGKGGEEGGFDLHEPWESAAADPMMGDLWDRYVRDAAKNAGHGSGIPQSLERFVEGVKGKGRIAWQQVLHDYIQFDRGDFVFAPPDRRYGGEVLLPSFQEEVYGSRVERVWFAVDTSGSVCARQIGEAFRQIRSAVEQLEHMEGWVSFFDREITEPIPFASVEDIDEMIPVGGGGTSFHVVFRQLKGLEEEELPRVLIVITDGYAPYPEESAARGVPVIWLITSRDGAPPFGEVLRLPSEQEKEKK